MSVNELNPKMVLEFEVNSTGHQLGKYLPQNIRIFIFSRFNIVLESLKQQQQGATLAPVNKDLQQVYYLVTKEPIIWEFLDLHHQLQPIQLLPPMKTVYFWPCPQPLKGVADLCQRPHCAMKMEQVHSCLMKNF